MLISLNNIKEIHTILLKFSQEKLPIKLSYKIMKTLTACEKELEFFQTKLNELIQECAELDEQGQIIYTEDKQDIKIQNEKKDYFYEQYADLINLEIDLPVVLFNLDELENLSLTPQDMYYLNLILDTSEIE